MSKAMMRTTLALPCDLVERADRAVSEGQAASRSELLATALDHELRSIEHAAVDAQFAQMAGDDEYQQEARRLAQEFVPSDWEALHPRARSRRGKRSR